MTKKKENIEITPRTDVYYYDEKGKECVGKDYEILIQFLFKRIGFYLVRKAKTYSVCYPYSGRLWSLWTKSDEARLPAEAITMFRDGFDKNALTIADIEEFIRKPLEYKKKHPSK